VAIVTKGCDEGHPPPMTGTVDLFAVFIELKAGFRTRALLTNKVRYIFSICYF